MFNETDRAYQESIQTVLDNKKEELTPEFSERLQKANMAYITRLKVISQSNYSYTDRKEIEDEEHRRFQTIKEELDAEQQDRLMEETFNDRGKLDKLYYSDLGREATLKNIEAMEVATDADISHQFNAEASEKTREGYLTENFEETAVPPKNLNLSHEFRKNAKDISEDKEDAPSYSTENSYSENEASPDTDFLNDDFANDNTPSEGFEP